MIGAGWWNGFRLRFETEKEAVLFLKKKNQKDFFNPPPWDLARPLPRRRDSGEKFFCFFLFTKRRSFFSPLIYSLGKQNKSAIRLK
jgi:hypothetical protein